MHNVLWQRATRSGSQRDESSHLLSDARPLEDVEQCFDGYPDEDPDDDSDAYVSRVEYFDVEDESDDDALYQLCEPESVVKKTQSIASRSQKKNTSSSQYD